jgi:hypothetical protein
MLRFIGGALLGAVAWLAVVTLLDVAMRHNWHDYSAVEKAMTFTLPMMITRLSESAVSSLVSGYIAALVDRGGWAPLVSGTLLLLLFAPQHYMLWSRFPIWYHLTFLVSLPLLSLIGGRLAGAKPATERGADR